MRGTATQRGYAPHPGPERAIAPSDENLRAYLPLVRRVVRRMALRKPPHIELDEMVSWGMVGLLDAFKKYDPDRQAAFETYAQLRIRGAILDRLRGMDTVARSVRQKAALLERTYRTLEGRFGRAATEEEVAAELKMSLPELQALLADVGRRGVVSLEDLGIELRQADLDVEQLLGGEGIDPIQAVLSRERVELVGEAVGRLPEKERTVIALYYHEGITMREVGEVLDLTESRVSQLHSQALLRLRGMLHAHFGAAEEER
jgi:RNA polymerase sigma factor FliA